VVRSGNTELVGFKFDCGLQSDCSGNKWSTPLHIAAGRGSCEVAKFFKLTVVTVSAAHKYIFQSRMDNMIYLSYIKKRRPTWKIVVEVVAVFLLTVCA
jgi:hypothetical protein